MQIWKHVIGYEVLFSWVVIGWSIAILLGIGALLMPYNGFMGAKVCAYIGTLVLLAKITELALTSRDSVLTRLVFVFVLYGVIGFALVETLKWVDSKKPSLDVPFAIAIEGIIQKPMPGGIAGPFASAIGCPPHSLASVDYMPIIRITNKQSAGSSIKSYSLELRDRDGDWYHLIKVPLASQPNLFFVHPAGYLTDMTPDESLDVNLSGKTLAPGQSVSGWAYFAFPPSFAGMEEQFHARVSVADFAGHSYTAEITDNERKPDPDTVPGGHDSVTFGKVKLNPADYSYLRITDCKR